MVQVESFNQYVFDDVKRLLEAKYSCNHSFDNVTFVLGYNIAPMSPENFRIKHPGRRIIVYNMEQLYPGSRWATTTTMHWLITADEVWDYDYENILYLSQQGIKVTYHPMEYCDALKYNRAPVEKDIDVLFYGSMPNRRVKILQEWMSISMFHATTIIATGISGDKLIDYICRSKIILNLHAYDGLARQEQVRMFVPVINGCCIVSERSKYNEFGKSIVEATPDKISINLKNLLKSGEWKQVGDNAPLMYKEHCLNRLSRNPI